MKRSNSISLPHKILRFKFYFLFLFIIVLLSCEYKPTGSNYVNKTLLEGNINVISEPGNGAEFIFTLPIS